MKAAFFCERKRKDGASCIDYVYSKGRRAMISGITDCSPDIVSSANFNDNAESLNSVDVIFSTWNMPVLDDVQIERLGNLKAIFYAAGSVKYFAEPYLKRGIVVVCAKEPNAVSVSEFALGQILLACKGYFRNSFDYMEMRRERKGDYFRGEGIFEQTVAILGAGMVGRKIIALLKKFNIKIIVVDPYLGDQEAKSLAVEKVSLEDAFKRSYVVSNHMPDLPEIRGIIGGKLFKLMRHGATFINTGRGAQVNEAELIATLKARPDLTALLDVTDPEPPSPDSELFTIPNLRLSSHIAGAENDDVIRQADYVIEQFKTWKEGNAPSGLVLLDSLKFSA